MDAKSCGAVAVYCGSSMGTQPAYRAVARSLGAALVAAQRPLVYGGGSKGIMGIVSGAVLEGKGKVTGVMPSAMIAAGGEGERVKSNGSSCIDTVYRDTVEMIIVTSMHERKVEMAKRSCGFVGLPGGFGTFEEVMEVTTWTQIGIHSKPVILVNVLSFFDPLRQQIQNAIRDGFIHARNASLITFVDGPPDHEDHNSYDWGTAVLDALESWDCENVFTLDFKWSLESS